tara:strand:+ start:1192 stop:1371 length:180 start_codon:yes stop_codon:yes gene_type:complete
MMRVGLSNENERERETFDDAFVEVATRDRERERERVGETFGKKAAHKKREIKEGIGLID